MSELQQFSKRSVEMASKISQETIKIGDETIEFELLRSPLNGQMTTAIRIQKSRLSHEVNVHEMEDPTEDLLTRENFLVHGELSDKEKLSIVDVLKTKKYWDEAKSAIQEIVIAHNRK